AADYPDHALDQRAGARRHDDERPADLARLPVLRPDRRDVHVGAAAGLAFTELGARRTLASRRTPPALRDGVAVPDQRARLHRVPARDARVRAAVVLAATRHAAGVAPAAVLREGWTARGHAARPAPAAAARGLLQRLATCGLHRGAGVRVARA